MKWTTWHLHTNSGWSENEYICNMLLQLSDIYQSTPQYYLDALLSVLTEIRESNKFNSDMRAYHIFSKLLDVYKNKN